MHEARKMVHEAQEKTNEAKETGALESKFEIAKNLLKQNVSLDIIMNATGLNIDEIEKL